MVQISTDQSRFNNDWYKPGGNAILRLFWYVVNHLLIKSAIPGSAWRVFLLKLYGAEMGSGIVIKPGVSIKYPWRLKIGDHSWIGEKVWIDNLGNVEIGKHCCISQGALLLCGNHDYSRSAFDLKVGNIMLEDGVWIGAKSVVCPGVTCLSHAVLSVGSVATKDLESYSIYAGVPATKVRERKISG